MTNAIVKTTDTSILDHLTVEKRDLLKATFASFLDAAGTATSRATYYNTKDEQFKAVTKSHENMFKIDRGIYALTLALNGVTDFSRQVGVQFLLNNQYESQNSILTVEQEAHLLAWMALELPPQRLLKTLVGFRRARINNSRTRSLILKTILNHPNIELWVVKYRKKMADVLTHALGKVSVGIIKGILSKGTDARSQHEKDLLVSLLTKHVFLQNKGALSLINECVGFAFGIKKNLTLTLLRSFVDARHDFSKGSKLPEEVLEGIRGRFHKDTHTRKEVLENTKGNMSENKKRLVQKSAQRHGAKDVTFNPLKQGIVDLYIYGYEMGFTTEILDAITAKAKETAKKLPVTFKNVGIVLDASDSMYGHATQKLRPMAVALATKDVLEQVSEKHELITCSGRESSEGVVHPEGDTELAWGVLQMLKSDADVIFVLSDGYENVPAGRTGEVIHAARNKLGIKTPIYHISPVMAAEAMGIRSIGEDVTTLPVKSPEGLGLSMLKTLFEINVDSAIMQLIDITKNSLQDQSQRLLTSKRRS